MLLNYLIAATLLSVNLYGVPLMDSSNTITDDQFRGADRD